MLDACDREALKTAAVVFLTVVGVVLLIVWFVTSHGHKECRTFCEDYGETAYYSSSYGCFCVTPEGKRYNPEMISKDDPQ